MSSYRRKCATFLHVCTLIHRCCKFCNWAQTGNPRVQEHCTTKGTGWSYGRECGHLGAGAQAWQFAKRPTAFPAWLIDAGTHRMNERPIEECHRHETLILSLQSLEMAVEQSLGRLVPGPHWLLSCHAWASVAGVDLPGPRLHRCVW